MGRGVVAIPEEESGKLRALLKEYHVPYVTRRVLLLEENKYRNREREPFKASREKSTHLLPRESLVVRSHAEPT